MKKEQVEKAVEQYVAAHDFEKMALKVAMFDMDGVLFDSMKNHAKSWHETMAHFGMAIAHMHGILERSLQPFA